MALVLALALGASLSAGAAAEPLCRDLKGLFTPCPKELNAAAAERLEARRAAMTRGQHPAQEKSRAATHPAFAAGVTVADPGKPHRPKLCRDLKGLYTPCPK